MKKTKSHRCFGGVTEFWEHSSSLTKTTMKFSMHRPENISKACGAIIWLSGLTCTEENFISKAGAQSLLGELNLAIICPDTSPRGLDLPGEHDSYHFGSGAGFYVDATTTSFRENYKMYSYINTELYDLVNEMLGLQGNISISGHSMGGHGALVLGLKNPHKYRSISAFSPVVNPSRCSWGQHAFEGYLGDDTSTWKQYDACSLVAEGKTHPKPILIDQGLADEFYPDQLLTENFVEISKNSEQQTQVNYRKGYDHSYYFISTFVEDHIQHHAKYLTTDPLNG